MNLRVKISSALSTDDTITSGDDGVVRSVEELGLGLVTVRSTIEELVAVRSTIAELLGTRLVANSPYSFMYCS